MPEQKEPEFSSPSPYQAEAQQLQAENLLLKGRVEKLMQDIQQKNVQMNDLLKKWEHGSLNLILKENQELLARLQDRENKLQKSESQVQHLSEELFQKNQSLADLRIQTQRNHNQTPLAQKELDDLRAENKKLREQLEEIYSEEFTQFKKTVHQKETAYLKSNISEMKEIYEEEFHRLQEIIQKKEEEIKILSHELIPLKIRHADLQKQYQNLKTELETMTRGMEIMKKKSEAEKSALADETEQKKIQIQELETNKENLQTEIKNLMSHLQQKEMEAKMLNRQIESLNLDSNQTRKKFQDQIQQIQLQNQGQTVQLQEVTQQRSEKENQIQVLNQQIELFKKKLEEGRAAFLKEITRQNEIIFEKDSMIQKLNQDLSVLEPFQKAQKTWQDEKQALLSKIFELEKTTQELLSAQALGAQTARAGVPAASVKSGKILLIEPNKESLETIRQALLKFGHTVIPLEDGTQLIDRAKQDFPDLILMNMLLGEMDGYSLSCTLYEDTGTRQIPVILIASNPIATEIFHNNPKCMNVKSFLYKPFSVNELLGAVQSALVSVRQKAA